MKVVNNKKETKKTVKEKIEEVNRDLFHVQLKLGFIRTALIYDIDEHGFDSSELEGLALIIEDIDQGMGKQREILEAIQME